MSEPVFPETIARLLEVAEEHGATDLFLLEGEAPRFRIEGRLVPVEAPPVDAETVHALRLARPDAGERGTVDGAGFSARGSRIRFTVYRELGRTAAVLRVLGATPPDLETLGLPAGLLPAWLERPHGLVLIAGRTGSGKSTTLAACLEWMNHRFDRHVVTIEDPVEYVLQADRCLFSQREVGLDVPTFADGAREAMRQSPDVMLIGEVRDRLTAEAALQAAETGHLVLATIHGANAREALERFVVLVPEGERERLQRLLSQVLIGLLCQRLLPAVAGGLALATEFFVNEGAIRTVLEEGRFAGVSEAMQQSRSPGMRPMTESLFALVKSGTISEQAALEAAPRPPELQRLLRGVQTGPSANRR